MTLQVLGASQVRRANGTRGAEAGVQGLPRGVMPLLAIFMAAGLSCSSFRRLKSTRPEIDAFPYTVHDLAVWCTLLDPTAPASLTRELPYAPGFGLPGGYGLVS